MALPMPHPGGQHLLHDWSQVRAVLFDAVGTLLYSDPPVAAAYAAGAARQGLSLDPVEIACRFRQALAADDQRAQHNGHGQTSEARERLRWQAIVSEVFPELPQAGELFEELWQHFADPAHWRLDPELPEVWELLEARGLTLGLASNFDARLRRVLGGWKFLADCPWVFISSELGFRKPHRQFFEHVANQLQLSPRQILLVGDHPQNDVAGALAAGWHAAQLNSSRTAIQSPDSHVVFERLSQLPHFLGA